MQTKATAVYLILAISFREVYLLVTLVTQTPIFVTE
jgi:hypothetical protein